MSFRVTQLEVSAIIQTKFTDLTPFITAANEVVTDKLGVTDLSALRLKEIERWMAAHFIAQSELQVASESISKASVTYLAKNYGEGLSSSTFGQVCISLDTTNTLVDLAKNKPHIQSL